MTAERLQALLAPVVEAAGCDLEEVRVTPAGRRSVVQVLVDRDGGIELDDVAEISRAVGQVLDAEDEKDPSLLGDSYVLEVGSPGVDRPLTAPRHWGRNTGRLVKVSPHDGRPFVGRVVSADQAEAVLDVDGTERTVLYDGVERATVQVEFARSET